MKNSKNYVAPENRQSERLEGYTSLHGGIVDLLNAARRMAARAINTVMTATYWEIGRRIVEAQQKGKRRAVYGKRIIEKLASDLTERFGRGYGADNLELMRLFYLTYPPSQISESPIRKSLDLEDKEKTESPIRKFTIECLAQAFPLSWTHYVRLMRRCRSDEERIFYETEALRGGWTVFPIRFSLQNIAPCFLMPKPLLLNLPGLDWLWNCDAKT